MIPTKKRLGYGGSAVIDGNQVLITGGSFESETSVPYLNMISTPPSSTFAGRVKHADGTNAYRGSLSFEVVEKVMGLFAATGSTGSLLERYRDFDVGIHDGENQYKMEDCKLTTLTLSGAVGGLLSAQVGFLAKAGRAAATVTNDFIRDDSPLLAFWHTGTDSTSDKVKDWSFTMTQDATLVYRNEDTMVPHYIKVGLVTYSLAINTYTQITTPSKIKIKTTTFTLTGDTTANGFSYGGLTDLGSYSYTFETAALSPPKSTTSVLTVA